MILGSTKMNRKYIIWVMDYATERGDVELRMAL